MEKELISIVVPIYNVELYLKRCIESIQRQTYSNIEIILVNDGSTDESGNICEEYAKADKRIKVLHKKNSGLSGARNVGIANAHGKYIAFIDSDDFVKENFIQTLYELIESNKADIAICNYIRGKESTFQNSNCKTKIKIETYCAEEMLKNWHGKYKHQETVAWNKLYLKEIFDKYNICYPEGWRCGEDVYATHQIVAKANKIVITNEVLYYYFDNTSGIMRTISEEKVNVNIMAQEKRIEFFEENGYVEACERMLIKLQKYYMLMYCKLCDDITFKKALKQKFKEQYKKVNRLKRTAFTERLLFWSFRYCSILYEGMFRLIRK